jgi:MSHA biogenesis protein MshJ
MKNEWKKFSSRIDALSLRERLAVFAGSAAILIFTLYSTVLGPQADRQKLIAAEMQGHRARVDQIRLEAQTHTLDPDAALKERLAAANRQIAERQQEINSMQRSVVPPDRMADMLENMLRKNGRLQLLALKTVAADQALGKQAGDAEPMAREGIFKHGVEMTVQGSYLDMLSYMQELESMPWKLYWGKASLDAGDYPDVRLTLMLYTLSTDRKWLKL